MYKRNAPLKTRKVWDKHLFLEHMQYQGGCFHYEVPDDMVVEAVKQGAIGMGDEGFPCIAAYKRGEG
jgi:hypothetical protein